MEAIEIPDTIIAECPYKESRFGIDFGKSRQCFNIDFICLLCKRCHVSDGEARMRLPYIMLKNDRHYNEEKDGNFIEFIKMKIIEERLEDFIYELQGMSYIMNFKACAAKNIIQ